MPTGFQCLSTIKNQETFRKEEEEAPCCQLLTCSTLQPEVTCLFFNSTLCSVTMHIVKANRHDHAALDYHDSSSACCFTLKQRTPGPRADRES